MSHTHGIACLCLVPLYQNVSHTEQQFSSPIQKNGIASIYQIQLYFATDCFFTLFLSSKKKIYLHSLIYIHKGVMSTSHARAEGPKRAREKSGGGGEAECRFLIEGKANMWCEGSGYYSRLPSKQNSVFEKFRFSSGRGGAIQGPHNNTAVKRSEQGMNQPREALMLEWTCVRLITSCVEAACPAPNCGRDLNAVTSKPMNLKIHAILLHEPASDQTRTDNSFHLKKKIIPVNSRSQVPQATFLSSLPSFRTMIVARLIMVFALTTFIGLLDLASGHFNPSTVDFLFFALWLLYSVNHRKKSDWKRLGELGNLPANIAHHPHRFYQRIKVIDVFMQLFGRFS
ncbi:putative signal peptide protein [Puccinia sorghi]|uniref:Putative signal peptide protein n=1 Tax=Puccinia sorghi TaxID=27349 RepID=A0A0L6VI03_9BASI|nr:putative signal peptide protein [Puccinia sorghi]